MDETLECSILLRRTIPGKEFNPLHWSDFLTGNLKSKDSCIARICLQLRTLKLLSQNMSQSPLSSQSSSSTINIGPVLVVGGCGFVGFHIVRHLLQSSDCDSVHVISRNPTNNCLPGVQYHAGDITDLANIRSLILQICPSVVIHAACPNATTASAKAFHRVTVQGTQNLLQAATEAPSVKAFIFTSSAVMAAGPEHIDLDESTPLADTDSNSYPYARTKALADKMVLEANNPRSEGDKSGLLTACIRLPIVYGEVSVLNEPYRNVKIVP